MTEREQLIEKMAEVMWASFYTGIAGPYWDKAPIETQEAWRRAAAKSIDDVAAPVLLREPSEDELNSSVVSDAYGGHDGCVKKAISNRLAQYTVAPDPRREALKKYMIKKYLWQSIADEDADGLLAAIDAAKESQ